MHRRLAGARLPGRRVHANAVEPDWLRPRRHPARAARRPHRALPRVPDRAAQLQRADRGQLRGQAGRPVFERHSHADDDGSAAGAAASGWVVTDLGEVNIPAAVPGGSPVPTRFLSLRANINGGGSIVASPAIRANALFLLPLDVSAGVVGPDGQSEGRLIDTQSIESLPGVQGSRRQWKPGPDPARGVLPGRAAGHPADRLADGFRTRPDRRVWRPGERGRWRPAG